MTTTVSRVHVAGFRSLRDVTFEPGQITVVIGPNGSGKSNLLSALRLIPSLPRRSLGLFVGRSGGASRVLHYGPKVTPQLDLSVTFAEDGMAFEYAASLVPAASDTLVFARETVSEADPGAIDAHVIEFGAGHRESVIADFVADHPEVLAVARQLASVGFFHFHDTSSNAPLRQNAKANDIAFLRPDGSNLAAYLFQVERADPAAWRRIHQLVHAVVPSLKALTPRPVGGMFLDGTFLDSDDADLGDNMIRLDWIDQQDAMFGPNDLSDGTLRLIALVTALAQPTAKLPAFIAIDEPELGLHPAALALFAGLVRSVSAHAQIVLATQSPALLDHFRPEEVVVAELVDGATELRRLEPDALASWLEEYTLSELYDKNVLGGRP